MLVQIGDHWIEPSHVTAVRASSLDGSKTCVWVTGMSGVDGAFLIDEDIETVIELLNTVAHQQLAASLLEEVEDERAHGPIEP